MRIRVAPLFFLLAVFLLFAFFLMLVPQVFAMWHVPQFISHESGVMSLEQEKSDSRLKTDDSRLTNVARATFFFAVLSVIGVVVHFAWIAFFLNPQIDGSF